MDPKEPDVSLVVVEATPVVPVYNDGCDQSHIMSQQVFFQYLPQMSTLTL